MQVVGGTGVAAATSGEVGAEDETAADTREGDAAQGVGFAREAEAIGGTENVGEEASEGATRGVATGGKTATSGTSGEARAAGGNAVEGGGEAEEHEKLMQKQKKEHQEMPEQEQEQQQQLQKVQQAEPVDLQQDPVLAAGDATSSAATPELGT